MKAGLILLTVLGTGWFGLYHLAASHFVVVVVLLLTPGIHIFHTCNLHSKRVQLVGR